MGVGPMGQEQGSGVKDLGTIAKQVTLFPEMKGIHQPPSHKLLHPYQLVIFFMM